MKKHLFFIVALVATTFTAHAQISKGNQSIGLSFNGYSSNSTSDIVSGESVDSKNKAAGFAFDYNYFVADKTAIGAFLGFGHSNNKSTSNNNIVDSKSNRYAYGIFGKKYFMISDKFGGLGRLVVNGGSLKSEGTSSVNGAFSKADSWFLGTGADAGFVFFPWKRLGIETSLNVFNIAYSKSNSTNSLGDKAEDSGYNITSSFSQRFEDVTFTLRYHFGFKK